MSEQSIPASSVAASHSESLLPASIDQLEYSSILLAVDASDHSNRATTEAVALAGRHNATVTATHVYAAQMHDLRFRQMEGGLPEKFQVENELERQRVIHDSLITRGLSVITDSYLDQVDTECQKADIRLERCSLEGKNYRALVEEANSGQYDLLILGAQGVGAIAGSRVGTVCQRVVRRTSIDTLVIRDPQQALAVGPIVVAIDGSPRSYGGLLTALLLSRHWQVPVWAVAAFDPYFHYVAFNRIAGVLSEEAGRVFRFQEQEKLHEEIIDSGLAKIYQGHLSVAKSIATDYGAKIETKLLDGKPHDAIEKFIRHIKPTLLIIGKTGIHADPDLDIGGNAEILLRNVDCAVLLSQRQHQPRADVLADVTTSWTTEARQRMDKVPEFVRSMARMAILRYAQERGHTVITTSIVEEATSQLMPDRATQAMAGMLENHDKKDTTTADNEQLVWTDMAEKLIATVSDPALRDNLRKRAEKKARAAGSKQVAKEHVASFVSPHQTTASSPGGCAPDAGSDGDFDWSAEALTRLMKIPHGFMRNASRNRIESVAGRKKTNRITLQLVEEGLADARNAMQEKIPGQQKNANAAHTEMSTSPSSYGKCPFSGSNTDSHTDGLAWSSEAEARLQHVPDGFCREMTRKAAETIARQNGLETVDKSFLDQLMETFKAGAKKVVTQMHWDADATAHLARAPDSVRGMLVQEIEHWSRRNGLQSVSEVAVSAVKAEWQQRGSFHLAADDPRNQT